MFWRPPPPLPTLEGKPLLVVPNVTHQVPKPTRFSLRTDKSWVRVSPDCEPAEYRHTEDGAFILLDALREVCMAMGARAFEGTIRHSKASIHIYAKNPFAERRRLMAEVLPQCFRQRYVQAAIDVLFGETWAEDPFPLKSHRIVVESGGKVLESCYTLVLVTF